jgi:hypothetical protein
MKSRRFIRKERTIDWWSASHGSASGLSPSHPALKASLAKAGSLNSLQSMKPLFRAVLGAVIGLLLTACAKQASQPSYFLSYSPEEYRKRQPIHYPVARQGNLTAWLTSDHARSGGKSLYAPGDPVPKYPIVGVIPAAAMPTKTKHDGSFLIVSGYQGPLFELWEGTYARGQVFTGDGGWIPVEIHQQEAVNTWVRVPRPHRIGGWSGHPVVIGDPARPDAIAGAMWYKSNKKVVEGGAASTRMLKKWLEKLRFEDFVQAPSSERGTPPKGSP